MNNLVKSCRHMEVFWFATKTINESIRELATVKIYWEYICRLAREFNKVIAQFPIFNEFPSNLVQTPTENQTWFLKKQKQGSPRPFGPHGNQNMICTAQHFSVYKFKQMSHNSFFGGKFINILGILSKVGQSFCHFGN